MGLPYSRVERENVAFFAEEEVKEQVRGFMQSTSPTRKRVRSFFYCVKRAVWVGGGKFSVRSVTLDYMISKLKDIDQHKLCPRRVKALKAYLIQQALKGDEQCPF